MCSTIGALGLNFSVRNGKRWNPKDINTGIADILDNLLFSSFSLELQSKSVTTLVLTLSRHPTGSGGVRKFRAISKARL